MIRTVDSHVIAVDITATSSLSSTCHFHAPLSYQGSHYHRYVELSSQDVTCHQLLHLSWAVVLVIKSLIITVCAILLLEHHQILVHLASRDNCCNKLEKTNFKLEWWSSSWWPVNYLAHSQLRTVSSLANSRLPSAYTIRVSQNFYLGCVSLL